MREPLQFFAHGVPKGQPRARACRRGNHAGIGACIKQISEPRNDGGSQVVANASGIGGSEATERREQGFTMPFVCRESSAALADAMRERSAAGPSNPEGRKEGNSRKPFNCCDIRHAAGKGLPHGPAKPVGEPREDAQSERSDWWSVEPNMGRVANGVADRVDRLKCLGNGQVPAVVKLAWETLSQ